MITKRLTAVTSDLDTAAKLLSNHEVVALPTETVYGLAGNAFDETAVNKIFEAKERPTFDPLIVHVSDQILTHQNGPIQALVEAKILSRALLSWDSLSKINEALIHFWPGPLTLVLPKGENIPGLVTSNQNTVAIRSPKHSLFQEILKRILFPLAAPSANRFGRISPTDANHVIQELDGRIAGVLDGGACSVGVESTIIKIEEPLKITLLRPGQVSQIELSEFFKIPVGLSQTLGQSNQAQEAPGMLEQHYAPTKPLFLFPDSFSQVEKALSYIQSLALTGRVAFLGMHEIPDAIKTSHFVKSVILSENNVPEEMAQKLFSALRSFDEDPAVDAIIVDTPENETGLKAAIRDRLNRASRNKPIH